jgi:hypothetical protein
LWQQLTPPSYFQLTVLNMSSAGSAALSSLGPYVPAWTKHLHVTAR